MKNKQYTLISIEGNIGSGKSTLLKLMKQNYPNVLMLIKYLLVEIHLGTCQWMAID